MRAFDRDLVHGEHYGQWPCSETAKVAALLPPLAVGIPKELPVVEVSGKVGGQPALRIRPLRTQNRTHSGRVGSSHMRHVWTAPRWQGFSSRLQLGRCGHVFGLT